MKAIILAAGRGSRLKSLTNDCPKTLVPFNKRPLLEHIIQSLRQSGISEIGIVSGYRMDMLARYADKLFLNNRWNSTGIFHSLKQATEWLEQETCIVSYSDIFYPADIVDNLRKSAGDMVIAYDPDAVNLWQRRFDTPLDDLEKFVIDDHQNITNIGGKPDNLVDVQGQYIGLFRLTPQGWNTLTKQYQQLDDSLQDTIDMTSLLSQTLHAGTTLRGVATNGPWGEIDHPTDISLYESLYPTL